MHNTNIFPEKVQCFLLHFAGGSCYSYDFLKKYVSSNIEFIPLELPGRGKRYDEPFFINKSEAINDYYKQIVAKRNGSPYIIFGHSMGATLGLSVTHEMEKKSDPPITLIVSGNPGPGIKEIREHGEQKRRSIMQDKEFKDELREIGGMPEEVLINEELYEFYSPILRADFRVLERDDFFEKGILLKIPIFALMGDEEKYKGYIENWKNFTSSNFEFELLSGGHFFINDNARKLGELIEKYSYSSYTI